MALARRFEIGSQTATLPRIAGPYLRVSIKRIHSAGARCLPSYISSRPADACPADLSPNSATMTFDATICRIGFGLRIYNGCAVAAIVGRRGSNLFFSRRNQRSTRL